jgi:methylated-DNA-[protein]-cysteine S-methyltransferase
VKKIFNKKCYEKLSLIPRGMITTYAEIANSLDSNAYRAVGNAMANNPKPISVPCHRVIRSDGSLGGYALGINKKIQLLNKEGIIIKNNQVIDYKNKLYRFPL